MGRHPLQERQAVERLMTPKGRQMLRKCPGMRKAAQQHVLAVQEE